ncbi:flagellar hook assembly protein FlgD [Psychrobacillus glaciei]|uniref:Basal-body rod modification protein FlgD n=2 Tax=Psychrobacillus glaciei TaxID=2283160 RepID=A0A5J6STE9_9BACI|nr:flagellar hook assembly protein FlgD [Psychrobacillus glaciei]
MNAITSNMYLANKAPKTATTGNGTLGKDAFLKILMAQLQNQDPTKPMDDSQFIAQMAQFSSLEQMTNLTTAFEKYAQAQEQTQMIEYSNFVGKQVKWHELTDKLDEKKNPIINEGTGTISSIKFVDGSVKFTLADGKVITPGNISEVISVTNSNSLVEASMMIGKTVSYIPSSTELNPKDDAEAETGTNTSVSAQVESVSKKDGKVIFNLVGGASITADQIISIK